MFKAPCVPHSGYYAKRESKPAEDMPSESGFSDTDDENVGAVEELVAREVVQAAIGAAVAHAANGDAPITREAVVEKPADAAPSRKRLSWSGAPGSRTNAPPKPPSKKSPR